MLVQARLLGGALFLILGFTIKLQSIWLVEVNLGVNTSSLLGNSLLKGFRNCCCAYNINHCEIKKMGLAEREEFEVLLSCPS